MSVNVRKSNAAALRDAINARINAHANACHSYSTIANGTTNGKLKTTIAASYQIDGVLYTKAGTDDLWDLSAQTATTGAQFRAFWLYVDASGTATIEAGANAASATLARQALPVPSASKCVFGVFTAGLSTNFSNALSSQGTITHGIPSDACVLAGNGGQAGYASRIVLTNA